MNFYKRQFEALGGLYAYVRDAADTSAMDGSVAELLAWARGEGIEEHDVDEIVADGLSAEASTINNGGLEAHLGHLLEKWGSVEQVKSMLASM